MEKILNPLFESMDINQDQKVALTEAFDKAVLVKTTQMLDEHVDSKVAEKVEILEEEYSEKVTLLEDSLDGYLDQVVSEFISENAPMYEAQISDEKAKTLLEMFDQMVKVVGVDMLEINEAKEDRDAISRQSAEKQVETLTEKVADMADKIVDARREADKYLQAGVIAETAEGLSILEKAKFEKLAEMVAFDRSASYLEKLETIKESLIDSRSDDFKENPSDSKLPGAAFKHPEPVDIKAATDFSAYL
jgi:hypothetical protein